LKIPQRRKLKFKKKKINPKLKVKPSNFLRLLRKQAQRLLKLIINKDGIAEHLMMLPELLLQSKFHPKLLMKLLKLLKTKRLLLMPPQLLPNQITLTLEIEKVITPTRGMNTGPPRLFQNHGVINIVLIEKTEPESQPKMRKKLLKLMDQVIKNKKLRMMLRRMLPLLQLKKPMLLQLRKPPLLQPRKLPLLQKLKPLFNLNLKLTQALPTKRKLLTKLSTIRSKPDLRLPKRISLITSPPTRNIDPSTPSPSPKRELPLLNPKLTQA